MVLRSVEEPMSSPFGALLRYIPYQPWLDADVRPLGLCDRAFHYFRNLRKNRHTGGGWLKTEKGVKKAGYRSTRRMTMP